MISPYAKLLLATAMGAAMLVVIASATRVLEARDGNRVEIVIRNASYELHGGSLKPDSPTTIFIRNMDRQRHGFVSDLFGQVDLRVETQAGITFGKGIKGVHINPGEAVTLQFTPLQEGQFKFECDLHPGMKGELLVLFVGEV